MEDFFQGRRNKVHRRGRERNQIREVTTSRRAGVLSLVSKRRGVVPTGSSRLLDETLTSHKTTK